eukprot:2116634-Amphidinium_carterae.2
MSTSSCFKCAFIQRILWLGSRACLTLCSKSLLRPLGWRRPVCRACTALTAPLQSLTTSCGEHSSSARAIACSSARYTDCRRPGRAQKTLTWVSV